MLINAISFLLVVFQLFHSEGGRLVKAAHRNSALVNVQQGSVFQQADAGRTLRFAADIESSDEVNEDTYLASGVICINSFARSVAFPEIAGKRFTRYRARSCVDDESLFLLHCNFRV